MGEKYVSRYDDQVQKWSKKRSKEPRTRKKKLTIEEIAVAARKEHMTYGQYVAKYGL